MMYLGIDLSKLYFDVTLLSQNGIKHYARFDNTPQGFRQLQRFLKDHAVSSLHACMEATNIYWEALALFLHECGYRVSVVNPARIKGVALSQLRRNKTDKLDSDVIVEFCKAMAPKCWTPPSAEQHKLRSLVRHRAALIKTRTQQKNRLASCQERDVEQSLQRVIATLQAEIDQVNRQIAQFIKQQPALRKQKADLPSIKGIGAVVAHTLMAEMYDLAEYENASSAAADAGVTPAHYESGATVRRRPKMCKVGKAVVRGVLFMPRKAAIRHNPVVRALAQRLEQRNKPPKVIIGAAMRKLMHLAYGVLKNQTPFDPNWHTKSVPVT